MYLPQDPNGIGAVRAQPTSRRNGVPSAKCYDDSPKTYNDGMLVRRPTTNCKNLLWICYLSREDANSATLFEKKLAVTGDDSSGLEGVSSGLEDGDGYCCGRFVCGKIVRKSTA